MLDQNCALRLLVGCAPNSLSTSAIMVNLCRPSPETRKRMLEVLGRLMQKKFVVRTNKRTVFADTIEPLYAATALGIEFVRAGKRITSGPNKPLTGARKPRPETFRQRLWNAFRIQKKATLPQLIEIARDSKDGDAVESNALRYMTALVRANVAVRLPTREKGHALTSPGHVRFALILDLGPVAPSAAKSHLVNLNDPRHPEKFIPYGANK